MISQTPALSCLQEENASAEQIVKVAIHLASAYHETQLIHLRALQDGEKPRVLNKLVGIYEEFLARSGQSEDAFLMLLQYVSR
jgi:hypothetical protein